MRKKSNLRFPFVISPEIYRKSALYVPLQQLLGRGLVTAEGEHWRRQRRLLSPLFSFNRLRDYSRLLDQCSCDWLDGEIATAARTASAVDIYPAMTLLAMRMLNRCLFSAHVVSDEVPRAWARVAETIMPFFTLAMLVRHPEWLPLPVVRRFLSSIREVRRVLAEMISDSERRLSANPAAADGSSDVMDQLMALRDEEGRPMVRRWPIIVCVQRWSSHRCCLTRPTRNAVWSRTNASRC